MGGDLNIWLVSCSSHLTPKFSMAFPSMNTDAVEHETLMIEKTVQTNGICMDIRKIIRRKILKTYISDPPDLRRTPQNDSHWKTLLRFPYLGRFSDLVSLNTALTTIN